MTNKIRILLAEDHQTVREGLKLLVNTQPDMEVVGEADNGLEVMESCRELKPDVVLMDISMPELNGLKATKKLKEICKEAKILALTRHTDDGYIQQMIKAGANGYVLKQSAPSELINAIRVVTSGKSYLDPTVTQNVVNNFAGAAPALRGVGTNILSDREVEILRLIAWGYSNKEIAARLDLSVKTIEAHKANSMKKLNMNNRMDIVKFALLQGWLQDN
jgi:DNA-binding NarL/FixJ family response regulator